MTDQEIFEEFELHADNGVPPALLPQMVKEVLGISMQRANKVFKQWLAAAGWEV